MSPLLISRTFDLQVTPWARKGLLYPQYKGSCLLAASISRGGWRWLNPQHPVPQTRTELSTAYHSVHCVHTLHESKKKLSIVSTVSIVSTGIAHELHTKTGRAAHYYLLISLSTSWFLLSEVIHFLQNKSKSWLDAHTCKLSGNWAGSILRNAGSQNIFAFIGGIRRKS